MKLRDWGWFHWMVVVGIVCMGLVMAFGCDMTREPPSRHYDKNDCARFISDVNNYQCRQAVALERIAAAQERQTAAWEKLAAQVPECHP